jgi:hypothetical protein
MVGMGWAATLDSLWIEDVDADGAFEAPLRNGSLARIRGLRNEFEAEVVRDTLQNEGIVSWIQPHRETALSGVFIPQRAWGSLVVRMDQAEQALQILREIRATFDSQSEDD